jgi:hypothetical protein
MSDFDLGLKHDNYEFRNQVLSWRSPDSKETFEKNCADSEKKELLNRLGWLEPNCITYKYNSFGFRDEEFDSRDCGIALGCSHTEGIGISEESTWPRVLSKLVGTHIWNLGVCGSSIDTAFRLLDYWILKLKPKFVVLCMPPSGRVEIFDNFYPISIVPNYQPPHAFYKVWASCDANAEISLRKNLLAIQQLCDQSNIPFRYLDHTSMPMPPAARDLAHYGVVSHDNFANQMHNLL